MSWLINKLTGRGSAPEQKSDAASPPTSSPTSPARGHGALLFAPPRPSNAPPASSWKLPADAIGKGTEVARAIGALYMQQSGQAMELKFDHMIIVLVKLAPFSYEFKICSQEKVLISQPLIPSLTFYFKPVSRSIAL
jgi:hypothetical protein